MKTLEEIRKTPVDIYIIDGIQYLKRDDVKLLLRGEEIPLTSQAKSDTRFDIPINVAFR